MTKAKPKTENKKTIKAVKEKTPKITEKAKTKNKTKPKPKTKDKIKTVVKPKTTKSKTTKTTTKPKTTTRTRKKKVEEKINFSVMSHILVPKHEIVSNSEVPSIMEEYNIEKKSQFPKILSDDAVIKEIGAKIGDVIRIYRKEPTGDCLYYRVVVSSKKV